MNTICHLCGQSIRKPDELRIDLTKEGVERVHHKHCSQVYNRLLSIYGDNFDDLALDRVKWGSGTKSGDLIELSLHDIRNSNFNHSEIVTSLEVFKKSLVERSIQSKDEIILLFSNEHMLEIFDDLLEEIFLTKNWVAIHGGIKIRLLGIRVPRLVNLVKNLHANHLPNLEINYLSESSNACFLAVFDHNTTFFYEHIDSLDTTGNYSYSGIISTKESVVWHATAAFETLWKQSILEEKVKSLSIKLKNNSIPNNNFVRILAHELKTPIQPILGFSDLIQNNSRLDERQKNDLLKIIARNARKLDIMTNNILDYARMENNNFRLNYEWFDIINVLEELISDYSIQINKKKIQIKLSFIKNPNLINADKVRIIEVFDNLLSNAIKFTENGEITISVETFDKSVRISVKDSGIGIKGENLDKIFSKFFTTDKLGTGLGLYISKIIVLKHSGSISAQNNDGSQGSTFTVTLPNSS
jgi:nitrogen-specific signal transduction histidine kinase